MSRQSPTPSPFAERNRKISAALKARGDGRTSKKRCPRCEQMLPRATSFRTRPNGYTESYCTPCMSIYSSEKEAARKKTPEQREASRQAAYLKNYGITIEEYDRRLNEQGGRCAICGVGDPGKPKGKIPRDGVTERTTRFSVDHCHRTGAVRGLLCHRCNTGLGHFDDDPERLRSALAYLG